MHKRLDVFEFGQNQPLTMELAALECVKNLCIILWPLYNLHCLFFLFIVACNEDKHLSLVEFGIRLDPTTNCIVSCH